MKYGVNPLGSLRTVICFWILRVILPLMMFLLVGLLPLAAYYYMHGGQ